jgi:hypothetical protein
LAGLFAQFKSDWPSCLGSLRGPPCICWQRHLQP